MKMQHIKTCDLAKALLRGTLTAGIKGIGNSKTIEEISGNAGSLERSKKLRRINCTNQETKGGGTEEWRKDILLNLGMKKGYLYQLQDIKKRTKMEYYKQLYANKVDNISERDKLLERHKLPKLTQVDIKCLSNSITSKDIKLVTENISTKKNPDMTSLVNSNIQKN